jgi:hypothetical protein
MLGRTRQNYGIRQTAICLGTGAFTIALFRMLYSFYPSMFPVPFLRVLIPLTIGNIAFALGMYIIQIVFWTVLILYIDFEGQ